MKKRIGLVLLVSVFLAGCFGQEPELATKTEKELVKTLEQTQEAFAYTEIIEEETEFGIVENEVVKIKEPESLGDETKMLVFAENLLAYGDVASDVMEFHRYLLVMAELINDYPYLMSTDEWQNLQEQWQELNDPID